MNTFKLAVSGGGASVTSDVTVSLANIEKIQVVEINSTADTAAKALIVDASGNADITDLKVTKATDEIKLTGSDAQNISVAAAADAITIDGGKNVTVTDATANKAIAIGGTTVAAGAITVTDTKQGTGTIDVDGGTDVTITATTSADLAAVSGGTIKVGLDAGTPVAPTGAVKITQNLNSTGGDADADDLAGGAISVKGGKTVEVTVNATSTATKAAADGDITIGTTTVTGDSKTTDVTVTQNASVTTFTTPVVAAVADQTVVTFKAMTAGQTATVNGLTFTASKALTAEQAAAAFANLGTADTQDKGGPTANGIYSGASNTAAFTSGAASGATVTFTAASSVGDVIALGGTAAPTKTSFTAGSAASGGVATSNTVTLGDVVVDDNATAAIKTITLNGFKDATLGGGSLDALTTLNLTNSAGDTTLTSTSKTLAVTLNDIDGGDVDLGTNVETLTLTTTGAASDIDLVAEGVKSLTIDAGVALTLQDGTNYDGALETVTIKGAGAVSLGTVESTALKSFSAADNTGGVTVSVSAKTTDVHSTFTKYVLSQGNDNVTLTDATVNKAIELGAGDDTITLAAGTTALAANIDGGTGSNTLVMAAADAETASADATFEGKISNFQRLTIGGAASQEVIDLANLDDISYVTLGSSAGTKQVVNVTSGLDATVEIGDIFKITVNGTEYSFTATAATARNVVEGLQALVDAHPLVVATEDDAKVILTATTAGVPFSVTSSATNKSGGADTQTLVTAEATPNAYGITLNNMANAGTVVLTDTGTVSVGMKDASGGSDSLNIVTSVAASGVTHGYITVAGVETINITATDTNVDEDGDGTTYESGDRDGSILVLTADAATTVTVTGNANQDLTLLGSDLVELVDASTLEGSLTFTASLADLVVKGGTGADVLTANADDVKLYGNGGGDTLKVDGGLRVNLYGGDGADTFEINASTSLDAYTVINGVDSGDVIMLNGANKFSAAKIALSLGADETLLNYANQAIKTLAEGEMGWFQRGGNTYIVQDVTHVPSGGSTNADAFTAGEDMIVMIVGLVDLGTGASFNTSNILEIA